MAISRRFFPATDLRLQHIDSLYAAIAAHVDLEELAQRLARRTATELGYDLRDVPSNTSFLAWAVREHHRIDVLIRREVGEVLGRLFKYERVDPNFSLAFTQLALDILGTHPLLSEDHDALLRWLRGEKLRSEELHRIHLSRRIDRYNARDMLHALSGFIRRQGYAGLFVAIDHMEDAPLGRDAISGRFRYGTVALADVYQSLREMVDNLPTIPGMLLVLAGQPEFLELPRGIKSYDALWLRIQHEILSPWFNRFAQVVDLNRAIQANLTLDDVRSLHQRLTELGMEQALSTRCPSMRFSLHVRATGYIVGSCERSWSMRQEGEMDNQLARHIIETLRAGVPSRDVSSVLMEGQTNLLSQIRADMEQVAQGGSASLSIRGQYGEGKSHLLSAIENMARAAGFAVSAVALSKETPFNRINKVYEAVAHAVQAPNLPRSGFEDLLLKLRPGDAATDDILSYAEQHLHPKILYVLRNYLQEGDPLKSAQLYDDLAGSPLTMADLRAIHRGNFHEPMKLPRRFLIQDTVDYFQFLSFLLHRSGYKGWVIMMDEVELLSKLGIASEPRHTLI